MKNYVKPTVDVVELSVKENMAALPASIGSYNGEINGTAAPTNGWVTTVYDLTALNTSNEG